jgi:hypothetical protein
VQPATPWLGQQYSLSATRKAKYCTQSGVPGSLPDAPLVGRQLEERDAGANLHFEEDVNMRAIDACRGHMILALPAKYVRPNAHVRHAASLD